MNTEKQNEIFVEDIDCCKVKIDGEWVLMEEDVERVEMYEYESGRSADSQSENTASSHEYEYEEDNE